MQPCSVCAALAHTHCLNIVINLIYVCVQMLVLWVLNRLLSARKKVPDL